MDEMQLRALLDNVRNERISTESAINQLRQLPFSNLDFAKLDHHRALRQGFPEVVLCEGKQPAHVVSIMKTLCAGGHAVLATRANPQLFALVREAVADVRYHELARAMVYEPAPLPKRGGTVLVISAGTADLPVAEEAAVTADVMGNQVERLYDVGVAGLHRLLEHHDTITTASVIIVVAGMEGALPSVVAGLVSVPVIAVPTSVGYGASFGGIAALLGMLNSCANGVAVVNIDNGFGAACVASAINHL